MTGGKPSRPPLAERMRPRSLADFVGQEHLVGQGRLLRELISGGRLPSLLLWGPPGSGKTTLANILASSVQADFVFFSAVLSGVKEVRQIVQQAEAREAQAATVLFVDEIHRFSKSQQDAFLPHVESGLLTLIGATTENPSFEVIAPLLSRCQVLLLKPLSPEHIQQILCRALSSFTGLEADASALELIAQFADGDCRRALNCLETAAALAEKHGFGLISKEIVGEVLQERTLRYDKGGEEHYNLISALHKSLRASDPDAACYWLGRMLTGGEDPLYIARRLIRFASEDVGISEPRALDVALHCREAYHLLGSPEGELALYQAVVYLATAPKSNALYVTEKKVQAEIKRSGSLPVPLHLRNAPTKLMQEIGYGKGYQYAHDHADALTTQEHLPEELACKHFYQPTDRGYEAVVKERLIKWREMLRKLKEARKGKSSPPAGPVDHS
jgi:putative ATPase